MSKVLFVLFGFPPLPQPSLSYPHVVRTLWCPSIIVKGFSVALPLSKAALICITIALLKFGRFHMLGNSSQVANTYHHTPYGICW